MQHDWASLRPGSDMALAGQGGLVPLSGGDTPKKTINLHISWLFKAFGCPT